MYPPCGDRGGKKRPSQHHPQEPQDLTIFAEAQQASPPNYIELIELCTKVREAGTHNFCGARLPVPTHLNIPVWRHLLREYPDYQVCDFLEYGWPINYTAPHAPKVPQQNHRSALTHPAAVDKDIQKDLAMGALIGPFAANPFPSVELTVSPLQTVPKANSPDERRIVVDLSFPEGTSVNDGIPKDTFLGEPTDLHYPSIDSLADIIRTKGRGALLFKSDLRAAYKQLPICPADWPLCGISWKDQLFVYTREIFGLRSSALACQRTTLCIKYLFELAGYDCCVFLDDIGGADTPDKAPTAFSTLQALLRALNLWESDEKALGPATKMIFLGILLNSMDFTMTIPPAKLAAARELLHAWAAKTTASKRQLQSLLGTLQHLCCCVRGGRVFLNRMLNSLRSMQSTTFEIDSEFRKDLFWWETFLEDFNGVSIMRELEWSPEDTVFSSDACPYGAGGFSAGNFFHATFPPRLQHLHINALEILAVTVCCKLWGANWGGQRLRCLCDNMCTVLLINTSRSRDPFLQACIRELWFLASKYSFELRATHISGVDNRIADHLSRWSLNESHREEFHRLTHAYHLREHQVPPDLFNFSHDW